MTKDRNWRRLWRSPYLWLFLTVSLLFGILFARYIFGEYAFLYLDIGADSFDINYPLYRMFSDVFHGKGYDSYFLNVGLGMDMSSYFYQYFNPLALAVVLMPERLILWSLLLITWVKLFLLAIFGYKLFYRWCGHTWGSFTGALVWTFSGYVMLWGQQYGFCTAVVMFTVFFYLVHLYVDDSAKSRNGILVLWVTLMLLSNYYFLYMIGIMGAIYVLIWLLFERASVGKIVRKLAGLAAMGILGISIGGVCLVSVCNVFFESTRASAVNVNHANRLIRLYNPRWLLSFLARLFSNNTLGIGWDYTGAGNYYETAMLSTSSLFFVALPALIIRKSTRVRTLILTALAAAFLVFPFGGKLFTMNTYTQRWGFVLCFMEAFAVAMFVKLLMEERDARLIRISVVAGELLAAAGLSLLYLGETRGYFQTSFPYIAVFIFFLEVNAALALDMPGDGALRRRVLPVVLTVVVCAELAVSNYPTINFRESPTRNQMAVEYYNDGTEEATDRLRETDDSLYRVAKTYESASENDSMVQGYNGLAAYMTVNPGELIEYRDMYGGKGVSSNFASFGNENFIRNSLLGVRYLVARQGGAVSARSYEPADTVGDKTIYENKHALPFGYLYDHVWEKGQIEDMEECSRTLAALRGFYFTDEGTDGSGYEAASRAEGEDVSLMKRPMRAEDCRTEETSGGIRMYDMAGDPHIVLEDVEDAFGGEEFYTVTVDVEASRRTDMALYYRTEGQEDFTQDQLLIFTVSPKHPSWTYMLPGDVTDLRLDVSTEIPEILIRELSVDSCPDDNAALAKLRATKISDITYEGNTYRASVDNPSENDSMLCVPFLYSEGWEASVDGQSAELYNINSGLCGVEIPPGSHEVMLRYEIPHRRAGVLLSAGGILVYLGWMLWRFRKKRPPRHM